MPRRDFLRAFDEARRCLPDDIKEVTLDDGEIISFAYYISTNDQSSKLSLKLIPTRIDDYPAGSGYILFTEDHKVDLPISNALERLTTSINGQHITAALETVSSRLRKVTSAGQAHNPIDLTCGDLPNSSPISSEPASLGVSETNLDLCEAHLDLDWQISDVDSDDGFGFLDVENARSTATDYDIASSSTVSWSKVKADLLATKAAGFKIGIHGHLKIGGVLCVSIRVAKLGISEEAMKAWALSPRQYLVLLISFRDGYRDLVKYESDDASDTQVQMHVALSDRYKPSQSWISKAFIQAKSKHEAAPHSSMQARPGEFEPLFIGKPLNDLLRNRFRSIIKYRKLGLTWTGAENLFNETQGTKSQYLSEAVLAHQKAKESSQKKALPPVVMADALSSTSFTDAALPLVTMQFLLRHFVRCTEFCLVCHCLTEDSFEALKPYVCSKPLCLYQFLSYDFGSQVEHEILTQPYVVDLLVSLCFSQAAAHRLTDKPTGLNLKVPVLPSHVGTPVTPVRNAVVAHTNLGPAAVANFSAQWNRNESYLTIGDDAVSSNIVVSEGDWIVVLAEDNYVRHFRVKCTSSTQMYLGDEIAWATSSSGSSEYLADDEVPVDCYKYEHDLDSLPAFQQTQAILTMLKCVPPIPDLRQRLVLQREKQHEASLRSIRNIPPASRELLRWIIASNRSCIVQVDSVSDGNADATDLLATEPRVEGMADWVQFRFAQGAPDKEKRFLQAIKKHATNQSHPSLFAWHGSPLYNWHSIIRNGLNFDEVLNGRANGNGVYMSSQLNTSIGYSQNAYSAMGMSEATWRNSRLETTQVVSLQEVVNAPRNFVSFQPHLVVAQKDWIQTRYLFVQSSVPHSLKGDIATPFDQDPGCPVRGSDEMPIQIPITAISKSRRRVRETSTQISTDSNVFEVEANEQKIIDEDYLSETTLEEDSCWFECDEDFWNLEADGRPVFTNAASQSAQISSQSFVPASPSGKRKRVPEHSRLYFMKKNESGFVPGALDFSTIPILAPPSDASPAATRALLKAYNATLHAQETTPLEELGFFLDPERVDNLYQWIIELHSFEKSLPLAQDMEKASVSSIVIEMRFNNQFPFSPPFVRVVKPRFLPFLQGGGGHVTEGGAICMELLTSTGWSVVSSIESVLLQIRLAMSERERPARLMAFHSRTGSDQAVYDTSCYGISEAVQAFKRACSKHGWRIPDGVHSLALTD